MTRPPQIRISLAIWLFLAAVVLVVASVPAYRAPWSTTVQVRRAGNGWLLSDPVTNFVTPFVSFTEIRFAPQHSVMEESSRVILLAGGEPADSIQELSRRTLIDTPAGKIRASQFRPVETIRVAVVGPSIGDQAEVTLGYDGRSAAVSLIYYWWPWLGATFLIGSLVLLLPFSWPFQVRSLQRIRQASGTHRRVLWLLLAAIVLRFIFVIRGGQYFDADEARYGGGAAWTFTYLSAGNLKAALGMLLKAPEHPGFRVVGILPAFFHVASAWRTAQPITEMRYPSGEWLAAFVFSLASVLSIALTYALANRTGASRRESFLAAFLMFSSAMMLMYARHFLPYDAAMAILLFALWIGLKKEDHPARSLSVGALAGFAFLTYEGYWLLAGVVGGLHVLHKRRPIPLLLKRGIWFVAGLSIPIMLFLAAGRFAGQPVLERAQQFSKTAVNGDFSEGWALPWAYFWNAEHGLLFVYALGIAALIILRVRRRAEVGYAWIWLLSAGVVYTGLVLGSNVLHRFVVYDRLARQMLPFICLAAAAGLSRARQSRVLYVIITVLFIANCVPLMAQHFPRDVVRAVIREYGSQNVRLDNSLRHLDEATAETFLPPEIRAAGTASSMAQRYVLLNAKDIWPKGGALEWIAPPAGKPVFAVRHPRQLRVMQYQGYRPEERAFLRSTDFSMQLIDTQGFDILSK